MAEARKVDLLVTAVVVVLENEDEVFLEGALLDVRNLLDLHRWEVVMFGLLLVVDEVAVLLCLTVLVVSVVVVVLVVVVPEWLHMIG